MPINNESLGNSMIMIAGSLLQPDDSNRDK